MLSHSPEATEERVLICAATEQDAEIARGALSDAGLDCLVCSTLGSLCQEIEAGAGAVLLTTKDALGPASLQQLQAVLVRQEPWSDLPLIMLRQGGLATQSIPETLPSCGVLVLLEQPATMDTLVSAVRTALRARRRQYQIRDLLQRTEEASRQKDQFLAMLAHELRNPLAPMSNAVHLMRMRGGLDPATERFRDLVERQVLHMRRLVDDLLDISRLTRGMLELHRAPLDLSDTVRQTVEDHRNELAAAGLALHTELPEEPVWVDGDADRLSQVLNNLIHNSVKATPAGGRVIVRLQVEECGAGDTTDASSVPNRCAVLTVRDTGAGIEPDLLPHVFDSYVRADDRSGGLGLGLPLAKQLVELHGGRISAASEGPGRGAEFLVHLPLAAPAASLATEPALAANPRPHLRVLLVEDRRDSADTLRELLQHAGHEVAVAHSGSLGIELAGQFHPNVVLCDLALAEMDARQVAAALRRDPATAAARLIALSGPDPGEARRSEEAGFDQHLAQPVDPEALAGLLAAAPRADR